ncbi:hypothetical protein GC176_13935 [bacterium]|nr:hypothetical protein [bacterium]
MMSLFDFLRRQLSLRPSRRRPQARFGATFEVMEDRVVLSSVGLSSGTLTIQAAAGETNSVNVSRVGHDVIVTDSAGITAITGGTRIDVNTARFTAVSEVQAFLEDGDDSFASNTAIPATVHGGEGADTLMGGAGSDVLLGENGDDSLSGGDGNDHLAGGDQNDVLSGGRGFDFLDGGDSDDLLDGGAGADTLSGGNGLDTMTGGDGDDIMFGGTGADDMTGGNGDDYLLGGEAGFPDDDTLEGGEGADTLDGGDGAYDAVRNKSDEDVITNIELAI